MEGNNVNSVEGSDELPTPAYPMAAIALSGSKKGKYAVRWALEKIVQEGPVYFRLLHVRPVISRIPTPMGNFIPVSQVRDDVAAAFRKDVELGVIEKLLPYKKMCKQKKVQVEIVQIESDDIATALSGEILNHKIKNLVIGSSSRSFFSRARTLSSKISECCPAFCSVYAVSKGKLSSLRPSNLEMTRSIRDDSSDTSCFTDNSLSHSSSSQTVTTDQGSIGPHSHFRSSSLPVQRFQALSTANQTLLQKRMSSSGIMHPRNLSLETVEERDDANVFPSGSAVHEITSRTSSFQSSVPGTSTWDQGSTPDTSTDNQANISFELDRLRIELRHVRGMCAMAQGEAIDASRKFNELQKRRLEEETKLEQMHFKEEEAKELARQEKERYEAAKREADFANEQAEIEAAERKEAEIRASRNAKEKENLESALTGSFCQFREFTWEEITSATSSFSEDLKIGMGAYGNVYKCHFHHTTAAVKILHTREASRHKQFQQELEILSRIQHPHLLILLGACPDHASLVYEFMENGSLEDRLLNKNSTSPLLWFERYRIAWEVASALAFLHNSKPKAIIHRDLKPANILLDRNHTSKIGDVGLSTMVNKDSLSISTKYMDTALVGTLCYIDPEYQRTGVVSPKSDIYAFGLVILQLLTAKPARALVHMVETAMENDHFIELLDQEAGAWPIEETKEMALMALKCTELRGRDRPDLNGQVLPVLEKLKEIAENAKDLNKCTAPPPPNHFICPILKEVMTDPYVAADGYTYDRKAIEAWLEKKDTSPTNNLPLPHKFLTPNYTLLSAIVEWKSGNH